MSVPRVGGQPVEHGRGSRASTAGGRSPGSQRRVPSSQASWGYWLKISPAWIWPMKTLGRPADRVRRGRELAVEPAEPGDQLGGGGDHARLAGGPHDLVDRRALAADDDLPGRRAPAGDRQDVAERLGEQDGIAAMPVADHLVELAAVAPGGLVQVVGRQQDRAGRQGAGIAQAADRLDGGGDPRLHVRRAAAGEPAVLDRGRDERQVHRVEVAVELERPAGPPAVEPDGNRRAVGWPPDAARREPVGSSISASRSLTAPPPVGLGTSIKAWAVPRSRPRSTWDFTRSSST